MVIPVLVAMTAVMAISVAIPVGMLVVRWFAESSSSALSGAGGNLSYLWPATLTSVEIGAWRPRSWVSLFALPVAFAAVQATEGPW